MERKMFLIKLLVVLVIQVNAQCWNTINTISTDPSDPNNNSSNTFDWTRYPSEINGGNPYYDWYWSSNTNDSPAKLYLPYRCNTSGVNAAINGNCADLNENSYVLIQNQYAASSLHDLNKALDILPEDGWELVFHDFGKLGNRQPMPSIILYNRYTGKLKVFLAATASNGSVNNQRAVVNISFAGSTTSLFGFAKPISPTLHSFDDATTTYYKNEIATPNSINALSGLSTPFDYQWLQAEINAQYDPCTCQKSTLPQINAQIIYFDKSVIDLEGFIDGQSTPVYDSYYSNNDLKATTEEGGPLSFLNSAGAGAEAILKGFKDWGEYAEALKKALQDNETSTGGSTNVFIQNILQSYNSSTGGNLITDLSSSTNISVATGLMGAGEEAAGMGILEAFPYVGAALGLIDLFSNGGKDESTSASPPAPPVAYDTHLKVSISGNIKSQNTLYNSLIFAPGSSSSYGVSPNAPTYNNILGVFNILNIPSLSGTQLGITTYGDPGGQGVVENIYFGAFDYKLTDKVKYMLNPASNLAVQSIEAAFVFEYNYNDHLYILPGGYNGNQQASQKQIPYYPNMWSSANLSGGPNAVTGTALGTMVSALQNAGMEIEYQSKDYVGTDVTQNAPGSIIRFRTKYVPLQCLQDVNFMLCGASGIIPKMYLKLYCKFKPTNNPNASPVTAVYTYDMTDKLANPSPISYAGMYGSIYSWQSYSGGQPIGQNNIQDLYVYGYYNTPNYGTQPGNGSNYTSGQTTLSSAATINIPVSASVYHNPNYATTTILLRAMQDINIGTAATFNSSGMSNPLIELVAGNNINMGNNVVVYQNNHWYAGNDIVIANNPVIVGNNIQIKAKDKIVINQTQSGGGIISGNVILSVDKNMSITSVLVGCENPDAITNYQESDANILAECNANGNNHRMVEPGKNAQLTNSASVSKLGEVVFNIYPNPTTGQINMILTTQNAGSVLVKVLDIDGREIMENTFNANLGANRFKLSLGDAAPGIYMMNVTDDAGAIIKHEKIVLTK